MTAQLARSVNESDFRGAPPELVPIPMFMDEEGVVYAFGHQHEDAMVESVYALHDYYGTLEKGLVVSTQDVRQGHARILIPENHPEPTYDFEDEDTRFMICKESDDGAFPITYWSV